MNLEIIENLNEARQAWKDFIEETRSKSAEKETEVDFDEPFHFDVGLDWISKKIDACCSLLETSSLPSFLYFSSQSYMKNVATDVDNLKKSIEAVSSKFQGMHASTSIINWESWFKVRVKSGQGSRVDDLSGELKKVIESLDKMLQSFFNIFLFFGNKNAPAIDNLITYFNGIVSDIDKKKLLVESVLNEATQRKETIDILSQELESTKEAVELAKSTTIEMKESVEGYLESVRSYKEERLEQLKSKIDEDLSSIKASVEKSEILQGRISQSEGVLEGFEHRVETIARQHEEEVERSKKLFGELKEKEKEVGRLQQRAEEMLSSSTAAGLAHHFETTKKKLDEELKGAKEGVWVSIVILAALSIPLLALVLSPLYPILNLFFPRDGFNWEVLSPAEMTSSWGYLGQSFSRAVVILPGIWLVHFSSSRYKDIFNLREHYSYKYTMAVSVEGFKKQAEGYESEIAAMVFEQIGFNPADKMDRKSNYLEHAEKNGIFSLVIKGIREKVFRKDTTGD